MIKKIIELKNIGRFINFQQMQDFAIRTKVHPNNCNIIFGFNGSGKSTLAKHMNALLKPTEGKMYVNDIDTTDTEKELEIRRNTG